MEKRFLLAFVLSFLVLFGWSAISPKPPAKKLINNTQRVGIKDNTIDLQESTDSSLPSPALVSKTSQIVKNSAEKQEQLVSEKLIADFSNMGGNLQKVFIKNYDAVLPITNIVNLSGYEDRVFVLDKITGRSVSYIYEDEDYRISKFYELGEDDYTITSDVRIQNKTGNLRMDTLNIEGFSINEFRVDNNEKKNPNKMRDRSLMEYVVYTNKGMHRKNKAFKFSHKDRKEEEANVQWLGFRDRYFCALIKPNFNSFGYLINPINDKKLNINIEMRDIKFPPSGSLSFASTIFFGPENLDILKKYDVGFEKIRRYYKLGLFDAIAKLIYGIMRLIYKIIPNWGICIILISTIIYFSMYPMTMRSMKSMRKMQAIQPKMAKLKEKHQNNPQKLNKEMMEIYKKHGVNPLGGCLPMLLQLPVFIGLYQVLWRSVSFKGAKFLWIKDLSEPDRLFSFPSSFPVIGNDFNLLPVLMVVIMAFQQRLTAKNMTSTDPQQIAQQKMMSTVMPFFMGFIFYKFASGLTLYFTMFYLFSTFTQWKISKEASSI